MTRNSGFKITTRNTRAASDLVKAEVLTKVEQMVTSFTSVITRELTKTDATTNGSIEAGLNAIFKSANLPDLTLVKNYGGDGPETKGVKRAVLIGINYTNNAVLNTLSGV